MGPQGSVHIVPFELVLLNKVGFNLQVHFLVGVRMIGKVKLLVTSYPGGACFNPPYLLGTRCHRHRSASEAKSPKPSTAPPFHRT